MKRFIYKARDKDGKIVEGEVEAQDATAAARLVRSKGFIVVSIRPKSQSIISLIDNYRNRITQTDVANFTRQFAVMINAGLPITDCLSILKIQSQDKMEPVIGKILTDIENGDSLSVAFSKHPRIFSQTYIALIKAGEAGGVLDKVLTRLADDLEKSEEFKGKIIGALIYPAIIIVGMVAVSIIMIIFVIPKLLSLYTEFNATLPLPTQILIFISSSAVQYWWLVLGIGIAAYFGITSYIRTPAGKLKVDELTFKMPVFGKLQQKIMLAELARVLALMVSSGVPIIEGMEVTANTINNLVVRNALVDAKNQIEKGFPLAFSFAKHPEAFPIIFSQMMAVGEESGKIDDVLTKLAQVFENESDQMIKGLTAAIEPIVMVILGIGVGFLVIAIILPIYNLTSQF